MRLSEQASTNPSLTKAHAEEIWRAALSRARTENPEIIAQDRGVYQYLKHRRLAESWEHCLFGTLGVSLRLPETVSRWPRNSYRLVVPLYDEDGALRCVQGRAIDPGRSPKVMTPKGGKIKGTVFADRNGLQVLRGTWDDPVVVVGEGLTDFLALAITSPAPVLAVPGTAVAAASIGSWAKGCKVIIAFDQDAAGEGATKQAAEKIHQEGGIPFRATWPGDAVDACDALAALGSSDFSGFISQRIQRCLCGRLP